MIKKKICIIGSGISGLSASLFLSKKYDVHLFEKNNKLGGHTRTINFKDNLGKSLSIDTGFIVFNEINYPDLVSFFSYLGVQTENSNMSFSFSSNSPSLEYGGTNLNSLFSQRKNILSLSYISLLFEINRFYRIGRNLNLNNVDEKQTIEEFLLKNNFSDKIRNLHIYPMISSIWSSNSNDVKYFPFVLFLKFFKNHGLFDRKKRPQWKFASGGSYSYVDALIKKDLFKFTLNTEIKKIIRNNEGVQLIDQYDKVSNYDKVIFATHANQVIKLLEDLTSKEASILSCFKYTHNKAYLHKDSSLMPKSKAAWSSWNFLQKLNQENNFSLTYWMNQLQKIEHNSNYFVSINPEYKPQKIIDETFFTHPIFNMKTLGAQKKLGSIQGHNNTFFCGSYCGYGFHEDGIQSAAYIAAKLNIRLPWKRSAKFNSRINY